MERTEVFELRTEQDVAEFCRLLGEAKELAPASLIFSIAVTSSRRVRVVKIYDPNAPRLSSLESGFQRLIGR